MREYYSIIRIIVVLIAVLAIDTPLIAQDLSPSAYSKLTWDHISTLRTVNDVASASIGLTTDNRMYVWGNNILFNIHTNSVNGTIRRPLQQTTPFYVPSPAGETIKKVQVKASSTATDNGPTYFCLSQSGKLYAWGFNNGLLETAWPVPTGAPTSTLSDTTRTKRTPVQLTILGESSFVDFDASSFSNYWVAIGVSGKAYHIGNNGIVSGGGADTQYTFAAMPNPAGVDNATFKYTRVWTYKVANQYPVIYLKGNNGKVYYTGSFSPLIASGVPSLYYADAPTLTTNETYGKVRSITPREVPFPTGVDIVKMEIGNPGIERQTTYALSADGKAYMAGLWKVKSYMDNNYTRNYVVVPLKTTPLSSEIHIVRTTSTQDTTFVLKQFVEVATPPGATKILDIISNSKHLGLGGAHGSNVVGDNHKVFWSGTIYGLVDSRVNASNFLSLVNNDFDAFNSSDVCLTVVRSSILSDYTWTQESINLEGASQLFSSGNYQAGNEAQMGIISKTGRGYFVGTAGVNTGTGKIYTEATNPFFVYPVPIANEQLLSCQSSPGTGGSWTNGPVTPTNTAVGVLDCSKTQLITAPVVGTVSNLSLVVTVNVTTAGTFTPITVSGSGMSVASGYTISTTITGVQQFVIPVQYDGTALGALNFTVGSAGTCSADLASTSKKTVNMDVWTLDNCTLKLVAPKLK